MASELLYITRKLDQARAAYAEAHPEEARLATRHGEPEWHILNALQFLVEEVEQLKKDADRYDGEQVRSAWHEYPNPDTRITGG